MGDRPACTDLTGLIDQATRHVATDPRHVAILAALKRLVLRKAFGPRFGDVNYKPILECNYEE